MSKWGRKHSDDVVLQIKRRGGAIEVAVIVDEMSVCVLMQEKELQAGREKVSALKDELSNARTTVGLARAAEAHMRGYIERVRELDPNTSGEKKPDRVEVAMERRYGVNPEA